MKHTDRTPSTLTPAESRLLESVVTWIQIHVRKAKGEPIMVQPALPGMPRPVNSRPLNEYRVEPIGSYVRSGNVFEIVDGDDNSIAIFTSVGPASTVEANTMLIQAMVETFNMVQQEIMDGR